METRRMRKRIGGTPVEIPPEWLPEEWTVEFRNTRHGKFRYYRSSVSGCTFQSKEEVLCHLSVIKHGNGTSGRASCSNESKKQLAEEIKESLEWLPSGWISEMKTLRSGRTVGKTCKSSDPVKKRKLQPNGMKHNLIEKVLDSNGELKGTATVPDRLLQLPSSYEIVEVKPEEGNAAESGTFSHTIERATKNGRKQAKKWTRKSNISNKKANMESKEIIELEKVTLRPSDEVNNRRESKPSKEEDEMKLIMACQKTSVVKVSFLDPQNNNLSELEEKELPSAAVGNPSTTPDLVKPTSGSRKITAVNAISRPQHLSRQLSSIEFDQIKGRGYDMVLFYESLTGVRKKKKKKMDCYKKQEEKEEINVDEQRDWANLPHDVLWIIYNKITTVGIIRTAQYVCTPWRQLSCEPELWRHIVLSRMCTRALESLGMLESVGMLAVDRSRGYLEDFTLGISRSCIDRIIAYMSERSAKLRRLCLFRIYNMSQTVLVQAIRNFPLLEELEISFCAMPMPCGLVKAICLACPHLKRFKFNNHPFLPSYIYSDLNERVNEDAFSIAKHMQQLQCLQLIRNTLTNIGLLAILNSCPNLQCLDIRRCINIKFNESLRRSCANIKELRLPEDSTADFEFKMRGTFDADSYDFDCVNDDYDG